MSLKTLGPKAYFWQWDIGRKLVVGNTDCGEVHFCNGTGDCALVVQIKTSSDGSRVVEVPNVLLQTAKPIKAYLFQRNESGALTRVLYTIQVIARSKPESYVYTETEVLGYNSLAQRIDEIEKNGVSEEQIEVAVKKYLDENPIDTGVDFETDATLKLENGILSVNTTNDMEEDNTLPITSAGVFATVGNIEALLKTI
jgi:hypothetical protein